MKQIVKYTLGWDTLAKEGYLTAIDETLASHIFSKLPPLEFQILINVLKEKKVFIDGNKWIISGWDENNP